MSAIARNLVALALLSVPLPGAAACDIAANSLHFGAIDPLAPGATTSAATVQITCDDATEYSIALGTGAGTYLERHMHSGGDVLAYQLYVDPARVGVWGDGTQGSLTVDGNAGPGGQQHTIYGRVPAQRHAVPGLYADTVVITVTW